MDRDPLARKTLDEMTRLIGFRPFRPTMGVAVLEPTRPPAKLKRVVDVRRNPGDEVVDRCLIQLHPCRRELDADLLPNVALKFS